MVTPILTPRPSLTVTSDRVLSCPQPRPGATVRLVCLPLSGGGPATFRDWHLGASAGTEVRTVVLPGRPARSGEPFAADPLRSHSPAHVVLFEGTATLLHTDADATAGHLDALFGPRKELTSRIR
ncbi:hypothetical protein RKD27_007570 [Streptomyces sp. SAI-126]